MRLAEMQPIIRIFESSGLPAPEQSLLLLVYEEALKQLRGQHAVATTQSVRTQIASSLVADVLAGERNSYLLVERAIQSGLSVHRG